MKATKSIAKKNNFCMTVKNLYLLMAREVVTDASDNMTSVIKIIDRFTFNLNREQLGRDNVQLGKQQINLPAAYSIATSWLFDEKLKKDTFITFKAHIISPSGANLTTMDQENMLPAGINKANMNFNAQGLPIVDQGDYTLRVEVLSKAGKILAYNEYPFSVEFN